MKKYDVTIVLEAEKLNCANNCLYIEGNCVT